MSGIGFRGSGRLLRVFNNNRFDHIRGILAFISHDLHHLVDIPLFDDLLGVRLCLEQPLDAHIEDIIGLILYAVDPHQGIGDGPHVAHIAQLPHCTAYLLRSPANAKRLIAAIESLDAGKGIKKTIGDLETN